MARPIEINREQALSQAMEVFWSQGYEASSVQNLLDAMGMNRGSMYSAFGDKRSLFLAAVDEYARTLDELVEGLIIAPENPLDAIRGFFNMSLFQMPAEYQAKGCLLVNTITEMSGNDDTLAVIANDKMRKVFSAIEARIIEGQEVGLINRNNSAKTYADFLMNSMKGFRVTSRLSSGMTSDVESMSGVLDITLSVLEPSD